ncbi:MAG: D-alanyl-D-alanine carboxypeptidase/D-alanyl-D-alanine-endopeptidase [Porphyromonadaceae bacterium]|nr:D-alanyl-D-alanine carboxypeptidase/D-alanyl-D-alanine-endopeptidase [Porphyromonadaceae bacterium]
MTKMIRRYASLITLALLHLCSAVGQATSPLEVILQAEASSGGRIGLEVVRCRDWQPVYCHREDERMTPASLVKILSTGAALQQRGTTYRFATPIYTRGRIEQGTLDGDVIIYGQGDPSIASQYIPEDSLRLGLELANALSRIGVQHITGRLIIEAWRPNLGVHPSWMVEDIGAAYGAGLYGLNYADNALDLYVGTVRGKRKGQSARIVDWDRDSNIQWRNELRVGKRNTAMVLLTPTEPEARITGLIPRNTQRLNLRPANPDPATYAGKKLIRLLKQHGISIEKPVRVNYKPKTTKGELLHTYYSQPLDSLARITNHRSHNLFAEAIASLLRADGSDISRGDALTNYWRSRLSLTDNSISLSDGSGLSRLNQITPSTLSRILIDLMGGFLPHDGALVESLPQLGLDGTVRSLMGADELTAYLKSGSMRGVQCYAGYIEHEGEWYILVYMANGFASNREARETLRQFLRLAFLQPQR